MALAMSLNACTKPPLQGLLLECLPALPVLAGNLELGKGHLSLLQPGSGEVRDAAEPDPRAAVRGQEGARVGVGADGARRPAAHSPGPLQAL